MDWNALLNPASLALMIPIVAIVGGIINAVIKHRERMAMIERGMDPDAIKKAKLAGRTE